MTVSRLPSRGLTIVEVLIALVIIGVAFVALTYTQVLNLRVTSDSKRASEATQVANEYLEILVQRILADYASFQSCPSGGHCAASGVNYRGYSVDYSISRGAGYQFEGLILVSLEVDGPASAELQHYVSCMDVDPPPTVANPGVCD